MTWPLSGSHAVSGNWGFITPHSPAPQFQPFRSLRPFTFQVGGLATIATNVAPFDGGSAATLHLTTRA